jgi:hypothetical protein
MTHAKHAALYITACPSCSEEYLAARVDPMRPPDTDEEPWSPPVEVAARPRQRWALILAVAGVAAMVLLLGGTRV